MRATRRRSGDVLPAVVANNNNNGLFLKSFATRTTAQRFYEFFGFFAGTLDDVHVVSFARRTYDI